MRRFLVAVTGLLAVFALGMASSHHGAPERGTQVQASCHAAPPGMRGTCGDSSWGG
ncbi:hypothetical protein HDA42_003966 [Streptomyces costaricanus]|uniref:Uncharacterized protein n=1 Tax=Streptomyces murinus TaxID=33900 RepID=A0A7W3NQF6_STRMR|nr:hypothetical protein [Streptomyces murinus]